jgi:hypothetical protein
MKWSDALDHSRRPLEAFNDGLEGWRLRARRALDHWHRDSLPEALRDAHRDGIKRAAAFVEEKGQRELGIALGRLAEEKSAHLAPSQGSEDQKSSPGVSRAFCQRYGHTLRKI